MNLQDRKIFSIFPPLNSHLKYVYLLTDFKQSAGIGAPIHRFCHPIPGGSVSLKFDTFFNRTRGGEPFLRTWLATLNTQGARIRRTVLQTAHQLLGTATGADGY